MKIEIGHIYKSKNYGEFIILNRVYKNNYAIKFVDTGYETTAFSYAISTMDVKDNLVATVCEIGCLGYASKKGNEKYYGLWNRMIHKCYNKNHFDYKFYGLKGVAVCDRWKRFDLFLEDIPNIDGFDINKFFSGELELDKDIKQFELENKIYSVNTCCFVTQSNNMKYREFSIQKQFIATSPNGDIHSSKSIREFCREFNLTATHVSRCLQGKDKKHKGWSFNYL